AWKWTIRNPAWAALIALCFLAPMAVAAVSVYFTLQLRDQIDKTKKAMDDADTKRIRAETAETGLKKALEKTTQSEAKERSAKEVAESERNKATRSEAQLQESFRVAQLATERLLRLAQSRLRYLGGTEAVRRELLQEALQMT